jgi:alpha-methylacyl-CoA racemase
MLLSDMGAEVVRIARDDSAALQGPIARGRHELILDLKSPEGRQTALAAIDDADVLVEGFRPGVMERLGLGPEIARARNPQLVYARMTGWGQEGPLAQTAGHDINFIALTGALAAIGPPGQPSSPPLNLVGDYGGGGLYLAFGIAAALLERERSGHGQVIDAAIIDGVASMMAIFAGRAVPLEKPLNPLAGAAPFYRCYICADGRQIAAGAIEPQFYDELLRRIGAPALPDRADPANWPEIGRALEAVFATRTQAEWRQILEGADACFAPVLSLDEAAQHPQLAARSVYVPSVGGLQPAPAPRFSRTPGAIEESRADGDDVIARWRAETRERIPGAAPTW